MHKHVVNSHPRLETHARLSQIKMSYNERCFNSFQLSRDLHHGVLCLYFFFSVSGNGLRLFYGPYGQSCKQFTFLP
jgi:hypothetical protein